MGKAKRTKRKRRGARREARCRTASKAQALPTPLRSRAVLDALLHAQTPQEPCWKLLPWVLALAFAVRAAVALAGNFVLHPDEIMQYLEPAHALVFGNGIVHWEFFYGGRSWLVPGLVAAALALLELLGFGQPHWYVDVVKLMFCAASLLIPAGMYFFARRHFGELAARIALVAGAFWYELVGFAHKPMTEFVTTALLCMLLVLCMRRSPDNTRTVWLTAALAVFVAAIRVQYAPIAFFLLGVAFLHTQRRMPLVLASGAVFLAVGVFDAVTWNAGLFHSYIANIQVNLFLDPLRAGESPPYQFLLWLAQASTGLAALCLLTALPNLRRYGFLFTLIAVILVVHSLSSHKEYRFIFAVVPLWLLIGSDLAARIAARPSRLPWPTATMASVFALVSIAGILNALPAQHRIYHGYSNFRGTISFFRDRDPLLEAYLQLARAPGVAGVLHGDRYYHELPGYYYLHRKVPFYDRNTVQVIGETTPATLARSATHILVENPELDIPGYRVERKLGEVRIWRREADVPEIRDWEDYAPIVVRDWYPLMRQIDPQSPAPPDDFGIRFANGKSGSP